MRDQGTRKYAWNQRDSENLRTLEFKGTRRYICRELLEIRCWRNSRYREPEEIYGTRKDTRN